MRRPLPILCLIPLLLAACATSPGGQNGAPYEVRPLGQGERAPALYRVRRGDTIYSIAREYDLTVRALIDANHLRPPFQLDPGQTLTLPTGSGYVVERGDTLLGISRRTGISFSTLARMNGLTPPYLLQVGQRLKLPAGRALATNAPPAVLAANVPPIAAPPPSQKPQAAILPPLVPPAAQNGGYTPLAARSEAAPVAQPPETQVPETQVRETQAREAPPPAAPPPAAPAPAETASLPPATAGGLIWPVHGEVIVPFGPSGKGINNDGINIAVPKGTPVLAAQSGIVQYAGNELKGFGNLLLIKHAGGLMTAYAHNDRLLVKRGELVRRGQKIALSGDSGGVGQPQLHFEVRQGTRAVDPMGFLAGTTTGSAPAGRPGPG